MNGVHDMGGMHGMGPIQYTKDETMFHAPWEGRVHAMVTAVRATDKLQLGLRPPIENILAADYLRMSYYEQRLHALIELMVKSGLVTRAEVESGKPAPGSPKATPALIPSAVPGMVAKGKPASREVRGEARFTVGQRVRARRKNKRWCRRFPSPCPSF